MPLISDYYRNQQKLLHKAGGYGGMGGTYYGGMVADVINRLEISHVLDYGCGSRLSLVEGLKGKVNHAFKYQPYDPCVPVHSSPPVPAELVVCLDVLEHIEEDCIEDVLDHLEELTEAFGFFSIDTGPASKFMSDGRNAHVLQRPVEWWLPRIMCRFDLQTFQIVWHDPKHPDRLKFYVIVNAKSKLIEGTDGSKLS
jgi:hypothetical protein